MLSEAVVEKLKEELRTFFGTELASIVLYGSYAVGKETRYSDIDLLIIVKRDFSDWRERREIETELRMKFYSSIGCVSPKVAARNELDKALTFYNPLLLNILDHGVVLFDDGTFAWLKNRFRALLNIGTIKKEAEHWSIAI
ncbi:MAG: nucleotidyltransferase domain-containing protein [Methanophagales archaeon ANME-1-THS]|nr:MAG: nucleotidyltransferase domain-containing protein [Methanophagales archaeon ANME-1-THS]